MDAVLLARLQFAITIGFHFIFPPLTIGLSWLIVWLLGRARVTGDETYRRAARFWITIFAVSFTMGVASGLAMAFQFGSNWAGYSRFVGDIFGAPLAIEAIFAFFLESTFLAVLLFGWRRVSPTVHWFAALMVAVGTTLSAFWILVANSWMQTPTAYVLRNGRAELTDFWGAVFNPSMLPRFLHTMDAALATGAFFMLGISAWLLLRGRQEASARLTLTLALWVAFAASVAQLGLGHYHAMQVAATQPAKLAAFEGHFETQAYAPLLLFGVPDVRTETVRWAVRLPGGLSILAFGRPDAVVQGLRDFPRDTWPPVLISFTSFHLMVALGMFFAAFSGLGLLLLWRGRLTTCRPYLTAAWFAIPLPFLANELGWTAAEVGRQPWIVYNVLRTSDAISSAVPAGYILASILMFAALYALLFILWIAALRHLMHRHAEEEVAPMVEEEVVG